MLLVIILGLIIFAMVLGVFILVLLSCSNTSSKETRSGSSGGGSGGQVIHLSIDSTPRIYACVKLKINGSWQDAGCSRFDFGSNLMQVESQEICERRHRPYKCLDASKCSKSTVVQKNRTVSLCEMPIDGIELNGTSLPFQSSGIWAVLASSEPYPHNAAIGFGTQSYFLQKLGVSSLALNLEAKTLTLDPPIPSGGVHTKWSIHGGHAGRTVTIEKVDGKVVPAGSYATIDTGNSSFISYNPALKVFSSTFPKSITFGGGQTFSIPRDRTLLGSGQMEPYSHNVLALGFLSTCVMTITQEGDLWFD